MRPNQCDDTDTAQWEARIDRVLDTLHPLDPTLTIVNQSRQPARDAREAATLAANTAPGAAT